MRKKFIVAAGAAIAVMGLSLSAQAQNIVVSTAAATSWPVSPLVYQTGAGPTTDSGGTTNDNDSWGGNADGVNGFGALAQIFEPTASGTLATAQLTMAGSAQTFGVELYNLGTPPAGYQAASGSAPTITQLNDVGGTSYPNLLASGDQVAYPGVASGENVMTLTFQNADANVPLIAGDLYALSLDPTSNADGTWWQRGGLPSANYNTGEGLNADGVDGLQNFEGKTSVRDFDLGITETAVPEPASIGLIGMACVGLVSRRRHRA
jgi:hypothetical protein